MGVTQPEVLTPLTADGLLRKYQGKEIRTEDGRVIGWISEVTRDDSHPNHLVGFITERGRRIDPREDPKISMFCFEEDHVAVKLRSPAAGGKQ